MAFHVIIQPRAHRDIEDAYEWIHERSPLRADRWLEGLEKAIGSLEDCPERYPEAPEAELFARDIRQSLYGKRKAIYRILFVIEEGIVSVLTVRHAARDWWWPKPKDEP